MAGLCIEAYSVSSALLTCVIGAVLQVAGTGAAQQEVNPQEQQRGAALCALGQQLPCCPGPAAQHTSLQSAGAPAKTLSTTHHEADETEGWRRVHDCAAHNLWHELRVQAAQGIMRGYEREFIMELPTVWGMNLGFRPHRGVDRSSKPVLGILHLCAKVHPRFTRSLHSHWSQATKMARSSPGVLDLGARVELSRATHVGVPGQYRHPHPLPLRHLLQQPDEAQLLRCSRSG